MTEEQLNYVEEYASYFFSPEEVAEIMGLKKELIEVQMIIDGPFKSAYRRGQLLKEAKLRKKIFELAEMGSGPAQVLAKQFIDESHTRNISL
jgi:predicted DNA-binding protein YlxM (UPF0122 family)